MDEIPFADRMHPQSSTFAMGVENETTGDSKPKNSPEKALLCTGVCKVFW